MRVKETFAFISVIRGLTSFAIPNKMRFLPGSYLVLIAAARMSEILGDPDRRRKRRFGRAKLVNGCGYSARHKQIAAVVERHVKDLAGIGSRAKESTGSIRCEKETSDGARRFEVTRCAHFFVIPSEVPCRAVALCEGWEASLEL